MSNITMYVSEELMRNMVNTAQEVAISAVKECSSRYNFSAEEAIRELGLNNIKVVRNKKPEVRVKIAKEVKAKAAFPLPYNGEFNDACCNGLRQNNGLYTQCQVARKGEKPYCKSCQALAEKSEDGVPEYGCIQQRLATGIFEYVDPKGRKPISYTKIMKKYKISEEQVLEEAGKLGIIIDKNHFATAEESKRGRPSSLKEKAPKAEGKKGRPKKSKKVLQIEGEEEDLFASLIASANNDDVSVISEKSSSDKSEDKEEKAKKLAAEKAEKAEKFAAEKAEKKKAEELAKKEKADKLAAEKAEKAAKLAAEKEEKAAKLAAEKEEKAAKLAADKLEKEAKLAAEKAEKEAKKKAEEEAKKEKALKKEKPIEKKPEASKEEDDEPDVVKKIEFEGKKYLKSKKTGIIYDYIEYTKNGEQVVVGQWNESKNKIDFAAKTDEESEDEYEEDD
jgi:hypothetical protein